MSFTNLSSIRLFWRCLLLTLGLIFGCTVLLTPTVKAVPITKQPAIEVKVSLGNSAGELKFVPNHLQFVAGQKYKLFLDNPSPVKHYFTSKDFADASWTQKVEANNVEVKGAIHELELKPGAEAEWVIFPMKSGTYELHCSISGHSAAGMIGEIVVSDQ
ncbi:MAG: biphenyl 2,3-dioxygenase [Moorea sp. SIO2B7]|nr:biphenyl 2,3-dioxygenase [Moorena sp. SIO2B7]